MIASKMKNLIASSSAIREMFEEGKRLASIYGKENVYDFSLGNPNVKPPKQVANYLKEIIDSEDATALHGYMNNSGYESVRKAIAKSVNKKHNADLNETNIVMTVGAAGGLNVVLKSIIDEGDEVIVFAPYFGEYRNYISNVCGKIIEVKPNPPTFIPDLDSFASYITNKTKAVIVNSPNNPTGVIYSKEFFIKLANILNNEGKKYGNDIYLISDEPYREIVYNNKEVAYIPAYYDNTLVCYSYSKSLSLPGERIGYILVPNNIADKENLLSALNVANRILGFVNAPSLQQKLIEKCVDLTCDMNEYVENKEILTKALKDIGYNFVQPDGAFYLFLKTLIEDDNEFCRVAKEYNLLLVPGSSFGCKGYCRIAYCVDTNMIRRSLDAFKKLYNRFN